MIPSKPVEGIDKLIISLNLYPEGSRVPISVALMITGKEMAGISAASIGSSLQRTIYEMFERAVNQLDT